MTVEQLTQALQDGRALIDPASVTVWCPIAQAHRRIVATAMQRGTT